MTVSARCPECTGRVHTPRMMPDRQDCRNAFHGPREETPQMTELYRVRIIFNAPTNREHVFYSAQQDSLADAQQVIEDMAPAIVHAVSVKLQAVARSVNGIPERGATWRTLPTTIWGQEYGQSE